MEQNFAIRVNGMAVRITCNQMKQSVWMGWRNFVNAKKLKKNSMMLRAYKNLKINWLRKK